MSAVYGCQARERGVAGCIGVETTRRGWDLVCPAGTVCEPIHGACVLPEQLEACRGLNELEACHFTGSAPGYRCRFGVCVLPYCGDGVVDVEEECDEGRNNMDVPNANCRVDCLPRRCGDGIRDDYEECDEDDLGGYDCASLGMDGGELTCADACHFETSAYAGRPSLDIPIEGRMIVGLVTADVDRDGNMDIIAGHVGDDGQVTVLLGDGAGGFEATAQSPILMEDGGTSYVVGIATGHFNDDLHHYPLLLSWSVI